MDLKNLIDMEKTEEFFSSPYGKPSSLDERIWIAPMGDSRIRLLPQPVENSVPYLVVQRHSYNYNGQSLRAVCPKTVGQRCPVCDIAWKFYRATPEMYGANVELIREIGAALRPITRYYFNAFIVSDPENPENEGQVKVVTMGRKLWNIVQQGWKDIGIKIFDPENGFDLIIRKRMIGQYPDYTTSSFAREASTIGKLTELMEQAYALVDLVTIHSEEELIEMFSAIPEVAEELNKTNTPTAGMIDNEVAEEEQGTVLPGIESANLDDTNNSIVNEDDADDSLDISELDEILKSLKE